MDVSRLSRGNVLSVPADILSNLCGITHTQIRSGRPGCPGIRPPPTAPRTLPRHTVVQGLSVCNRHRMTVTVLREEKEHKENQTCADLPGGENGGFMQEILQK